MNRILGRLICLIKGHKPARFVAVELGRTPEGEPSIEEFERWTGRPSDILGVATGHSYVQCERCGKKFKKSR